MKPAPVLIEIADNHLFAYEDPRLAAPVHKATISRPLIRPVVKWPGGKQWLAPAAQLLEPPRWNRRYHEPFLGGGAFFFALQPDHAILSDINLELIRTYRAMRDDPDGIIRLLRRYPYDRDFYYRLRRRMPQSPRSIAARFIYLNRTCWNGLYRVNKEGRFNTPFGNFSNPTICDEPRIRNASRLLRRATLHTADFGRVLACAEPGDWVYIDPPYVTGRENNGFLKYNRHLFSWSDQERLAEWAIRLARSGTFVLVSNACHPAVISLYKGLMFYRVSRRSLIAGQIASRGPITEALFSNYPVLGIRSEVVE